MSSFVSVNNLVVQTHIGCGEYGNQERSKLQNITVNIKAYFDPTHAYLSDELVDTVDYTQLVTCTQAVATEKPRHTLEKFAYDIAKQIHTACPKVTKCKISLEKYSTAIDNHQTYEFEGKFEREKMEKYSNKK